MAKWYSIQGQKKSQVHIIFVASGLRVFSFPLLYTRKDAMKMSKYIECLVYEVTLLKSIEYANKLVR